MNRLLAAAVFVLWWCYCIVVGFWPVYAFRVMDDATTTDIVMYSALVASVSTSIALSEARKFYTTRCIL